MSDATRGERSTLNRRQLLRLSTAAGIGAALPGSAAAAQPRPTGASGAASATCSTPRTAVAKTRYGKVRGYVEDGVLTFKGVPYGATTGGENRWRPENLVGVKSLRRRPAGCVAVNRPEGGPA